MKHIARNYNNDMKKLRGIGMDFFAVNKHGEHDAAPMRSAEEGATNTGVKVIGSQYAVHDGRANKMRGAAYLFETPKN